MAQQYKTALFSDIEYWSQKLQNWEKPKISTLYFWWWTPLLLGAEYLIEIITKIEDNFDCLDIQELSIECNPYPYEQTLEAVQILSTIYKHIPRVRFSFGIQSLDDNVLKLSNRDNDFMGVVNFTQQLLAIKQPHMLYNYDFIAFGIEAQSPAMLRLINLLECHAIDSYSLYTLELFAGAKRYHETKDPLIAYQAPRDHDIPFTTNEDSVFDEFTHLKQLLIDHWYQRYEISNYALPGRKSIHNQTYRNMIPYLGLWLGAHSLLISHNNPDSNNQSTWPSMTRWAIALWWKKYIDTENRGELMTFTPLDINDIRIETIFLWLRQRIGLKDLSSYSRYLVDNRQSRIQKLVEENLVTYNDDILALTDAGMNVQHRISTYLLRDI